MTHCHRHTAAGLLVTKAVDGRTAGTAAPRVRVRCGVLSWSLAATFGHGYALCACATPVRRSRPARGDYGAGLQSLGRAMQPHGRWAAASRAQFERGARLQLRGARVTMRALWRLVTERMRSGCQRRARARSARVCLRTGSTTHGHGDFGCTGYQRDHTRNVAGQLVQTRCTAYA